MRIAENDLRAHVDEFVDEEQATFKHFLVDEQRTLRLYGRYQDDTQQVGRETGPWRIGNGHHTTIEEGVDLIPLLRRNENIVAPKFHLNTQSTELLRNDPQLRNLTVFDRDLRLRHGGHSDKRANLDHVGQHGVLGTCQFRYTFDGQQVRPNARDFSPHAVEHLAQLLQVRLTGRVVDRRCAFSHHGSHQHVGRTGHLSLIEQHIRTAQVAGIDLVIATIVGVVVKLST